VNRTNDLHKKILITTGPTREALDPVRYISNRSTGKMGHEIAEAAINAGYEVCVISGPVENEPLERVEIINVTTAEEMKEKVEEKIDGYDCIIMAAAVSDFKPEAEQKKKIKKTDELTLKLVQNADILKGLIGRDIIKVGFALETGSAIENGLKKLEEKDLDVVVINVRDENSDPFGKDNGKRRYILARGENDIATYESVTKKEMAGIIIDTVGKFLS